MASTHNIQINANIKTQLTNLDAVIKQLQDGLREGANTKIDMTKGVGKSLSKLITNFQEDFSRIKSLTPDGDFVNILDSKEFQRTGESIIKTIKEIQRISSELGTKGIIDAKKLFPDAFDARVTNLQKELTDLQDNIGKIASKKVEFNGITEQIEKTREKIKQLNSEAGDLTALENSATEVENAFQAAGQEIEKLRQELSKKITIALEAKIPKEVKEEFEKKNRDIASYETKGVTRKGISGQFEGKGIKVWSEALKEDPNNQKAKEAVQLLREYNKVLKERSQILKENPNLWVQNNTDIQKDRELVSKTNLQNAARVFGQKDELDEAITNQTRASAIMEKAREALNNAKSKKADIEGMQKELDQLITKAGKVKTAMEAIKAAGNTEQTYSKLIAVLGEGKVSKEMLETAEGVETLRKQLTDLDASSFNELKQALAQFGILFPDASSQLDEVRKGFREAGDSARDFNNQIAEVENLKSQISYFFGLSNSIQLLKRTITSAMNTVKELDSVMTETAVVTDFTIGDMWEKLPEYTDQASALGVSIKDLYGATTLYYQQGLKSSQAMDVGVETMKMARIAGMDAANATQAMTAALRGFNMEIDEMSAARVSDVYSELAAITAADTSQIATAMTKTASIASSANMEFETTAALLAQIIETTQEAPETAGTAMKTIIARFTEVKELFDQGMLSGQDSEGQTIEINKIDTALRTVGISLADFLNGTKGIDDIFLELAAKWDTLDLATQRYIATTAAGSRQQSRFIAMMSNYDRTMELVNAANNSGGASQEQFNKTLDSMESKLQNLSNAWAEFTMGIANNEILKTGVDILAGLLNIINELTASLSGGGGFSKSFFNLMTVIGMISGGKKLAESGFRWIGNSLGMTETVKTDAQEKEASRIERVKELGAKGVFVKQVPIKQEKQQEQVEPQEKPQTKPQEKPQTKPQEKPQTKPQEKPQVEPQTKPQEENKTATNQREALMIRREAISKKILASHDTSGDLWKEVGNLEKQEKDIKNSLSKEYTFKKDYETVKVKTVQDLEGAEKYLQGIKDHLNSLKQHHPEERKKAEENLKNYESKRAEVLSPLEQKVEMARGEYKAERNLLKKREKLKRIKEAEEEYQRAEKAIRYEYSYPEDQMADVLEEEERIKKYEALIPAMEKQIEDIKRNESTEEKQVAKTLKVEELQSKSKEIRKKATEEDEKRSQLYGELTEIDEELGPFDEWEYWEVVDSKGGKENKPETKKDTAEVLSENSDRLEGTKNKIAEQKKQLADLREQTSNELKALESDEENINKSLLEAENSKQNYEAKKRAFEQKREEQLANMSESARIEYGDSVGHDSKEYDEYIDAEASYKEQETKKKETLQKQADNQNKKASLEKRIKNIDEIDEALDEADKKIEDIGKAGGKKGTSDAPRIDNIDEALTALEQDIKDLEDRAEAVKEGQEVPLEGNQGQQDQEKPQAPQASEEESNTAPSQTPEAPQTEEVQALAVDLGAVAAAAAAAAGAFGLLGNCLEEAGFEGGAEMCKILTTSLGALGTALSIIPGLMGGVQIGLQGTTIGTIAADGAFKSLGITLGGLAIGFIAVVAVVATLVYAWKAIQAASPEGQLKAATQAANDAAEAAENAAQAYQDLADSLESIEDKQTSIENLTAGTTEWKNAVQELNNEVLDLIEKFPELAQYVKSTNGVLEIDKSKEEEVQGILNKYQDNKFLASSAKAAADMKKLQAEQAVNLRELRGQFKIRQDTSALSRPKTATTSDYLQSEYGGQAATAQAVLKYIRGSNKTGEKLDKPIYLEDSQVDSLAREMAKGNIRIENESGKLAGELSEEFGDLSYIALDTAKALREYGQELIAMEEAQKVYAKSIMSNAIAMTENVPENQRENLLNFYSPEQIQVLKERAKVGLREQMKEDPNELKKQYAEVMGYTYSNGNLYLGDPTAANKLEIDDESIIEQLAGANVTKTLSNNVGNIGNRLAGAQTQASLYAAYNSGDYSNLSYDQLKEFKDLTAGDVASGLGYKSADSEFYKDMGYEEVTQFTDLSLKQQERLFNYWKENGESPYGEGAFIEEGDTFDTWMANNPTSGILVDQGMLYEADHLLQKEQAAADLAALDEKFNDIMDWESGNWIENNLSGLSYDALNNLYSQAASQMGGGDKSYLNAFSRIFNNKNLSDEKKQSLTSYLSTVDWSSMTQAMNAMEYMQEMGLDTSAIEYFWNVATSGADTFVSSMNEVINLIGRFRNNIKNADDIEDSLISGKATDEQIQQLINSGIDISNFEITAEGWRASEEEAKAATKQLRERNAWQARYAAQRQEKEAREALVRKGEFGIRGSSGNFTISEDKFYGAITAEEGRLIAGAVTNENVDDLGSAFGLKSEDYKTTEEFHAAVQEALNNYINLLNNHEMIQTGLDKAAEFATATTMTTEEAIKSGASDEAVRMAMEQEAKDLGLDPQAVTEYAEALGELNEKLDPNTAKQLALDQAKKEQAAGKINDNWQNWQDAIHSGDQAKKSIALDEMAEEANKLLGVVDVLNKEFLASEKNMKLVEKAAKGDAKAFQELQKLAGLDLVEDLKGSIENNKNLTKEESDQAIESLERLKETIENFDDEGINVGDTIEVGDVIESGSLADQLTTMYTEAYNAAIAGGADVAEAMAAANEVLASQGYEAPEMVAEQVTVTSQTPPSIYPTFNSVPTPVEYGGSHKTLEYDSKSGKPFTYTQTRLVPKGSGGFTKTSNSVGTARGGGGGGGGAKENSVDKLYNISESIDKAARERDRLELRYQRLLDRRIAIAKSLYEQSQAEIDSLREQAKYQKEMVTERKKMLKDELNENLDLQQYATVDLNSGQITIDWELIDNAKDTDREEIEEYLSKLEELRDSMRDAEQALEEIEDSIWEIEQRGREQYLEFEDKVKNALEQNAQKQIDSLQEINDSINESNEKLIESIQSSIDKMRQERENKETEKDLQEKQRRLSYLEQDTSGANALEILNLREEIRQGQEDYTDTLIDQKISELQEQNENAAEQREQQITLLQNQLDWYVESGRIWSDVQQLIRDGIGPDGSLLKESDLLEVLKTGEQWSGLSELDQMNWLKDLENLVAESMSWRMSYGQLENLSNSMAGQTIEFLDGSGNRITGTVDENGMVTSADGASYNDVYQWVDGSYYTQETKPSSSLPEQNIPEDKEEEVETTYPYGKASETSGYIQVGSSGRDVKAVQYALNQLGHGNSGTDPVNGSFTRTTAAAVMNFQGASGIGRDGIVGPDTRRAFKAKKYKTGGLADYTGPAWLDGTKSRPELVLNQRDTQNFIQLKDILSSIMTRNLPTSSVPTENSGDFTFDIDINVESIGSDYDIEQVASKVKTMITDTARYRNNNAISLTR